MRSTTTIHWDWDRKMKKDCKHCNGLKGQYKEVKKGTKTVRLWVPCSFCLGTGKRNTL